MNTDLSYEDAFNELQQIVSEMEGGNISVDDLAEKVKRASTLITICKHKLQHTQQDVDRILKEFL